MWNFSFFLFLFSFFFFGFNQLEWMLPLTNWVTVTLKDINWTPNKTWWKKKKIIRHPSQPVPNFAWLAGFSKLMMAPTKVEFKIINSLLDYEGRLKSKFLISFSHPLSWHLSCPPIRQLFLLFINSNIHFCYNCPIYCNVLGKKKKWRIYDNDR